MYCITAGMHDNFKPHVDLLPCSLSPLCKCCLGAVLQWAKLIDKLPFLMDELLADAVPGYWQKHHMRHLNPEQQVCGCVSCMAGPFLYRQHGCTARCIALLHWGVTLWGKPSNLGLGAAVSLLLHDYASQ